MANDPLPPLRKVIELAVPPAEAFRLWTANIASWWPLASHSVGQEDAARCAIEGWPAGRIVETTRTDVEHLWGQVIEWAPPRRLVHSWHPGRAPEAATRVELTFAPAARGGTRLELVHGGWRPGDAGRRAAYDEGWDRLLRDDFAAYVKTRAAEASAAAQSGPPPN